MPHSPPPSHAALLQSERQALMEQLRQLQAQAAELKAELANYSENDPERYEALSELTLPLDWPALLMNFRTSAILAPTLLGNHFLFYTSS